ncbi:MAG TPA: type II toxin-antitoxin system prevent-host-death family antitoxin [Lacipirellulaceae bacterium]|nr:type II toxin-antitoxin system prevent-host-death family antitoxin [Lacipirellulaceae bacterium]
MTQIALLDAQQRLAELVEAVARGEEFVITLEGRPVAKVSPADQPRPRRRFGSASGKVELADDFDAPLESFADYM